MNGEKILEPQFKVNLDMDVIELDGKVVEGGVEYAGEHFIFSEQTERVRVLDRAAAVVVEIIKEKTKRLVMVERKHWICCNRGQTSGRKGNPGSCRRDCSRLVDWTFKRLGCCW